MTNENLFVCAGRLTTDPELIVKDNFKCVNITLAQDRYVKKGQPKKTNWIPVKAFNKNAELIAQYYHKGDRLAFSGEFQTESYTDKEGKKRTDMCFIVDKISFAMSDIKRNNGEPQATASQNESANAYTGEYTDLGDEVDDDELPF